MAIEIVVPRLGWSMDEGTFVEWLKQDGEKVEAGEMLFVLEGEKASQEIESFDAGILRIPPDAPQPGDEVVVSQLLAYLVEDGEVPPFELEGATKPEAPEPPRKEEPITQATAAAPAPESQVPEPAASPPAKRTAITPAHGVSHASSELIGQTSEEPVLAAVFEKRTSEQPLRHRRRQLLLKFRQPQGKEQQFQLREYGKQLRNVWLPV